MRNKIFQRHCNDELLIAHLDGELSDRAGRFVQAHLKACWQCRAHLAELEEQVIALATAMEDHTFPAPDRIAAARSHFAEWARGFQEDSAPAPRIKVLFWFLPARLGAIAVGVLVCLGALGVWSSSRPARPEAELIAGRAADKIIARAQEAESQLFRKSVHQVFRVETAQIKPITRRDTSRLEVWSEDDGGRFASVWRDPGGVVKHAIWRPAANREYIYNPAISSGPVKLVVRSPRVASLTELAEHGLDPEHLTAGFMKWLEERHWRPISFAADLSSFASQDGALLQARHVRTQDGGERIWLSVRRGTAGLMAELSVEIDANAYRPRLTRIRFETPRQAVEFCLIAERTPELVAGALAPAVFEPHLPVMPESRPALPTQLEARPLAVLTPAPFQVAAAEIETRYALHRARACLGEPIEVVRTAQGNLLVRGLVHTSQRKAQLLAALADLQGPLWLEPEIRTVDEAVGAASSSGELTPERGTAPAPGMASAGEDSSMRVRSQRLAIQDELEEYFTKYPNAVEALISHGGGQAGGVSRMVAQFANQVVSRSEAALAEAWALRRLAERYGSGKTDKLPPRSRWLLEVMVTDHLRDLHVQVDLTRRLLEPVLAKLFVGPEALAGASAAPGSGLPVLSSHHTDADWGVTAYRAFAATEQMHSLVLALYAPAGGPSETPPSKQPSAAEQIASTAELVKELLSACSELPAQLRRAGEMIALKLSQQPRVAAFGRDLPE
jgi:hypothetical protein